MDATTRKWVGVAALAGAVGLVGGCSSMHDTMHGDRMGMHHVTLSGAHEVPPVSTGASGKGMVTVNPDRTVTARIMVSGMTATAAHIHEAAEGANGPVIVPFNKVGDNTFVAPDGAKLTESQYESYKAGRTYVNVHSAEYKGGEVRVQLKGN